MYIFSTNKTRKYFPALNLATFSVIVFILLALQLLTSCSSTVKQIRSTILIESDIIALCKFTDAVDTLVVRTPGTIHVDTNNGPAQLSCKKDGYKEFVRTGIKGTGTEYKYPEKITVSMSQEYPDINISEQDTKKPVAKYSLSLKRTQTFEPSKMIEKQEPQEASAKTLEEPEKDPVEIASSPALSNMDTIITDQAPELDKKEMSAEPLDETPASPSVNKVADKIPGELAESKDNLNTSILAMDPAHYTLQFFSMRDESNAIRGMKILRANKLGEHAIHFSYMSKSGQWHKIIYGDYASVQDARDALQTIPEDSQIPKPWIRKISTIQNNIRMSN